MVGHKTKAGAVENDGAIYRLLGSLKLSDNLLKTDTGIFFRQHLGKIHFNGFKKMNQRPGTAPGFIKNIVNFKPPATDVDCLLA